MAGPRCRQHGLTLVDARGCALCARGKKGRATSWLVVGIAVTLVAQWAARLPSQAETRSAAELEERRPRQHLAAAATVRARPVEQFDSPEKGVWRAPPELASIKAEDRFLNAEAPPLAGREEAPAPPQPPRASLDTESPQSDDPRDFQIPEGSSR